MTPKDFELMLNFIARECCLSEEKFKAFKRLGVNPIEWPAVRAKALLVEFFSTVECLNYRAAQGSHGRALVALEHERFDLEQIRIHYRHQINISKARDLASQLLEKPHELDKIISEYKSGKTSNVELRNVFDSYESVVERHLQKVHRGDSLKALPSFPKLSKAIGGFNPGRVTIISAQTGFGKTKLAINLADSASEVMPTVFYNMEMDFDEFTSMLIQKNAKIKNKYWADGSFVTHDNAKAILEGKKESFRNLSISNGKAITTEELLSSIYIQAETTPHFIVIDYDQKVLIERTKDEWFGILKLVEALEEAAKVTESHVILLAQANDLGNIKASARAQQPASAVLNFTKLDDGRFAIQSKKNRFGEPFTLEVDYDPSITIVIERDFINYIPKTEMKRVGPF